MIVVERHVCPVFVCLWESLSAAAWGLSSAECVQRSALEWSESEALLSCGSVLESERCVVRGEVWEALAEELSVSDAWERVSCMLSDWRADLLSSGRAEEVASAFVPLYGGIEESVLCPVVAGRVLDGLGCAGCAL